MNEKKFTKEVESNYFRSITYLSLIVGCGLVWYSIFTNGFFVTLTWLMVISAILGLYLKHL